MKSVCHAAAQNTKTGHIGIIATPATIARHAHKEMLLSLNNQCNVIEQACPELVPTIEAPTIDRKKIKALLEDYLEPIKKNNVDTLIIGCTHYALIKKEISSILGNYVHLVCAEDTVCNEISPQEKSKSSSILECFVTGDKHSFAQKAFSLLKMRISRYIS